MRLFILPLGALMLALVALTAEGQVRKDGGRIEYTPEKLPQKVKVKAGETLVVHYRVNPAQVEEVTGKSDTAAVRVKGETGNDGVRITVRSDQKGKAKVEWTIHLDNGQSDGRKGLEVEFE